MANNNKNSQLTLKKATLEAWAKILLKEGIINIEKCNKMVVAINKIES